MEGLRACGWDWEGVREGEYWKEAERGAVEGEEGKEVLVEGRFASCEGRTKDANGADSADCGVDSSAVQRERGGQTSSRLIGTPSVIKCSRLILDRRQSNGLKGGNEESPTNKFLLRSSSVSPSHRKR